MFNPDFQHILNPVHHRLDHLWLRKHRSLGDCCQLGNGRVVLAVASGHRLFTLVTELEPAGRVMPTGKNTGVPVFHGGHKRVRYDVGFAQDRHFNAFLNLPVFEQVYGYRDAMRIDRRFLVLETGLGGAHPLIQVPLFDAVPRPDLRRGLSPAHRGDPVQSGCHGLTGFPGT